MPSFTSMHVQQAFDAIQQNGIPHGFGPATKWNIIDNKGERYPPKAVLFLAKQFAEDDTPSGGGGNKGTNNALRARGFTVVNISDPDVSDKAEDVRTVINSSIDSTTKTQLIDARLGQGGFRAGLLEVWSRKCALTALAFEPVLRASHIKPWRDSTDVERLDRHNGFLLAANVDALFDQYLISFDDRGCLLVGSMLDEATLTKIGIHPSMNINLKEENRAYLRTHRTRFYENKVFE